MLHPLVGEVTSCIPPWHSECPLGAEPARVGLHCQELPGQSWCSVTALPLRLGALPHGQVLSIHPSLGKARVQRRNAAWSRQNKASALPCCLPCLTAGPWGMSWPSVSGHSLLHHFPNDRLPSRFNAQLPQLACTAWGPP